MLAPMRVRRLGVLVVVVLGGCGGGPEPDRATSILSDDKTRTDLGRATEKLGQYCKGSAPETEGRRAVRTLEAIANSRPHAALVNSDVTVIQYLELLEGAYAECDFAQDLGDHATALRDQG